MNFYESISVYYDEIFPLTQGKWNFAKEGLASNSTILDIGCGTGKNSIELAKRFNANLIGIDNDKDVKIYS